MRKIYLFFLSLIIVAGSANAQISNLCFSASSGTYDTLVGGAELTRVERDDDTAQNIPIGFTFNYLGTNFTDVSVNSNGFIILGSTKPTQAASYMNDLTVTTVTLLNSLFPLWDDLSGIGGTASYLTAGLPGSRIFTVEWKNWRWGSANAVISFQVKLYEGTNVIEFVYRREAGTPGAGSASIGLIDATGGVNHFLSLNNVTATPAVSSIAATNNINPVTLRPATGQIYRFSPTATPTVTGFSPNPVCSAGASVTITGTNFVPCLTGVSFNGTAATTFAFVNATTVTATVPAGATTGPVSVTTSGGTATSVGNLTISSNGTIALSSGSASPTLCIGNLLSPSIVYAIGGGATAASITAGALPAGMTGLYSGGDFTISGTPTVSGSFPYTVTTSGSACTNPSLSGTITVNTAPSFTSHPSTATQKICVGSPATALSVSVPGTGLSYQWYSNIINSNSGGTPVGTSSNTYIPSSATAGVLYYYCTVSSACTPPATSNVSGAITVNARPIADVITGAAGSCVGGSTTLSPGATGAGPITYTWSSTNTGVATVSNAGVANGIGVGTTNITYTATDANGCVATSPAFVFSVTAPTAGAITGAAGACTGSTANLASNATGSGPFTYTWNSTNTTVATVSAAGVVSALTVGSTNISYTVTDVNGCSATSANFTFSVTQPTANDITGATEVCAGNGITLSPNATGFAPMTYAWLSGNTAVATVVGNTGVVTGVAAGTSGITYAVTDGNGCTATSAAYTITVNASPGTTVVTGAGTFCASTTVTASGGTGGTIYFQGTTSGGTSTAIPSSSQTVTTTGTYYFRAQSSSGCWGPQGNVAVTINPLPAATTVSGAGTFCASATIIASGGTGGTIYFQGTTSGGTSTTLGGTPQTVTTSGTYYFRSRSASGCWGTEGSVVVTINPLPAATTVSGAGTFCASTTVTASGGTGGTVYFQGTTSNGTSTATLSSSQTVTTTGTYYFRSQSASGCWGPQGSAAVTINTLPAAVTVAGGGTFCGSASITATGGSGGTIYFQGTTSGGTSTTLGGTPQTITTSGTYYFRSRSASGCWGTEGSVIVTINPSPVVTTVSGTGTFCASTTVTASGGTGGIIYFQGTTSNGTSTAIPSSSQTVTASGTYYFRSQSSLGCWGPQGSVAVTINALPAAVTVAGGGTFCGSASITATGGAGGTIYFQGTTSGGTSTTLGGTPQTITTSGTYYFRSRSASGCWGTEGSVVVTINPLPAATTVSGAGTFCASTTVTASGGTGGTIYFQGTTSNGTSTATLSSSQTVTTTGTYYFRSQSASGCWGPQGSVAVTINALPAAVTVSGGGTFCGSASITATGGAGGTIYFQGTTSGGTSTATASSSQTVTASGTYYFRSRSGSGCWGLQGSVTVTINPLPAATTVSGAGTFCGSATITASGAAGGTIYFQGTTSGGTSIASPGNSQVVTASGTYYFRAQSAAGCWGTQGSVLITITPAPTGALTATEASGVANNDNIICSGAAVTFTATPGFSLYKFYKIDAANDSTVVQNTSAANAFSSSTLSDKDTILVQVFNSLSCASFFNKIIITVNPLPAPTLVPDNSIICDGDLVTFTASGGNAYNFKVNGSSQQSGASGTYTSTTLANGDVVTVDVTNGNKCTATSVPVTMTVNAIPTGSLSASATSVCVGLPVTFTATGGNQYQFRINGTIAQAFSGSNTFTSSTIPNGGVVTVNVSNAAGCATTYLPGIPVTINAAPTGILTATENSDIPNDYTICAGAPVTFTFSQTGYSTYDFKINGDSKQSTSSNSFITSALAPGDAVTVDVTSGATCSATFTVPAVTIVASPVGALSASKNPVCAGDPVTFTATAGFSNYNFKVAGVTVQNGPGNTFTSATLTNGNIITVDVSNTNGCITTFNPITLTVNPLPTGTLIPKEISGNTADDGIICAGATVVFTAPAGFSNYNFILNNISVQTGPARTYSNSTLVTGDKIEVAVTNAGNCIGLLNQVLITVNPLPVVAPVSGPNNVCLNNTITLSDANGVGVWASLNTAIATADAASGVVTGKAPGIATITYTFTNTNGCSTTVSTSITVNAPPTVAPITGNLNVCTTGTSQLADATAAGVWSSGNDPVATVDASGLVTGIAAGTAVISYSVTDANGCTTIITADVIVGTLPVVAPITTGASSFDVCESGTLQLTEATTGGTWNSSNTAAATINSAGLVSGIATGTTTITYSITTSCGQNATATQVVTVNAPPSATISYAGPYCTSSGASSVTQTGTAGGTYSSTAGLTINSADGTITPSTSTAGTYTVSYKIAAGSGCALYTTTATVTITAEPSATIAYSGGPFCTTAAAVSVTRNGTPGGTYSSTAGLTINGSTGAITPSTSTTGIYTVTYTVLAAGGCAQFATTTSVTITTAPSATISYGASPYCSNGGTASVTQTGTPGGTYTKTAGAGTLSLNSTTGAIVLATSTPGTYTVTYTIIASGGCAAFITTAQVTITGAATAIAGTAIATCANTGTVNITAGSGATNTSGVTWSSSGTGTFTNANSLTLATYTPGAADITAGSVTLTLTANGNAPCGNATSTKALAISAVPATFTITASATNLCLGSSANLFTPSGTSTLFTENFEGANIFTVANTSPHSNGSEWIERSSTYNYDYNCITIFGFTFCVSNENFNSGSSKFMLAISDQFSNTNTSLVSPSVSTMGMAALSFSYRTFYRDNGGTAVVEVSTNNGASWTTVQTLSNNGNKGTAANFSPQNINLNAYINQPSFKIRFRYTVSNDWYWAVDDIILNGTSPTGNFSWTATPAATAGLPAGAGTPSPANANIVVVPTATGTTTYTAVLTNPAGCTATKDVAINVSALPVVTVLASYCAVPGKVQLTATATAGATLLWNTGATTPSIDVDVAGDYVVTATIGGCSSTATISVATELVVNGDFSAGNGGFTSDYNYKPDGAGNNELVDDSGNNGYSITTNGQNVHNNFWGKDHTNTTSATRNFMAVNGHGNTLVVWKQTVNVLPSTTYYFSAWAMSLNASGNNAQLRFSVNGAPVGTTAVLANHGESNGSADNWVRFYGTWTSGTTTTTADIYINDLQSALGGNDFGLDDISFGTLSTFVTLESAPGTDAQVICKSTPLTDIVYSVGNGNVTGPAISGLPAGITSVFAGDRLTISGTPTVAGNYTYTITTAGCKPFSVTGTITVQEQKMVLSAGNSSPSVCVNTPVNIGYTISGTATGAVLEGMPALPDNVSGSLSGNVFTISGTPTVAGVFLYRVISSGTCKPDTLLGTITVRTPTITLSSAAATTSQTVCINTGIANIRYTAGGGATGATVTGTPAGVSGAYNGGIFTITGIPTESGTFNYTVTATSTCGTVTATGTINVTPAASLILSSVPGTDAQVACNNVAITPITYSVNDATGASITAGALPAGTAGIYNAGVFTISGTPTVGGTFNYTVTTSGGCAAASRSGSITVNAQTIALTNGIASPAVCQGTPMPGIVYTISGAATGATVSGLPAGVTGVLAGNLFTISGTPTDPPGPYTYTVTTSGTSCSAATIGGTITIQPVAIGGTLTSTSTCGGANGTLTLAGQSGIIDHWESSTDGFVTAPAIIANITISLTYNITVPTMFRVVMTNGCGSVYSTTAAVSIHNYWTGNVSSDWNIAANWSDGNVPDATTCQDVYIPGGASNQPVLSSGTTAIVNLHIFTGAILTVTDATLQIKGSLNNAGTFIASNGTIEFNGSAAQVIPAASFDNNVVKEIKISNTSGVTLAGPLDINEALTFGIPGAILNTGGNLTLKSTATATAWVGDMTSHTINGDVTVERYINIGPGKHGKAWEFVTAPVAGVSVWNSWMEGGNKASTGFGTQVTGPAGIAAGFDMPTPSPSLKYYDPPSYPIWWKGVANSNVMLNDPADPNTRKGYMLFVRGDRSVDGVGTNTVPNATTLRAKGKLITGDVTFSVPANSFASIGNPYAGAVNMKNIERTGDVNEFFTVWNSNLGGAYGLGAYETYSLNPGNGDYESTPGPVVNNFVQSGQAFFVQSTGALGGNMIFKESFKANASGGFITFFRPGSPTPGKIAQLRTNLYVMNAGTSAMLTDGTLQQFGDGYNNGVDGKDARKFYNSSENLAIRSGGQDLIIERRNWPSEQDTVFYRLTNARAGNYRLELIAVNLSASGVDGFVEDTYLNTRMPLSAEGKTVLDFAVTNVAGSYAADRFRIVYKAAAEAAALPVTFVSLKAYKKNEAIALEWKVQNEANMQQYEVEKSTDGSVFSKAATIAAGNTGAASYNWPDQKATPGYNYYRIRGTDLNGKISYTETVKVLVQLIVPEIKIHPNPITNGIINLHLINQPAGTYNIRLLNPLGQTIVSKQVTRAEGTTTEHIQWNYNLAHGTYQLQVTKPNGELKVIKVMY